MVQVANKYIFSVTPYVPGKPIEDVRRELGLKSVVKLASNENPYPPSPKVLTAMAKAAAKVNRYPDGGCFELRRVMAKHLKVQEDQLIFGNGSDEIIVLAVRAFAGPGDEVIVANPSFLIYAIAARLTGATVKTVPLVNFRYDLNAMRAQVTPKTKIIFIGNPDNPAGTYVTKAQVQQFLEALPRDVLVFFDEAYFEYVDQADYPDTIQLLQRQFANLIVTRTFSKMYGLAGLRVGYGIARAEVIDVLNRLREPFNVNAIAQAAAVAAIKDQAYYKKIATDVAAQRQYVYRSLTAMGLRYVQTFTNFILIDVRQDSSAVAQALLKKGVIVRDMKAWGLSGYIRVSIGTGTENKKFIKTLKDIGLASGPR